MSIKNIELKELLNMKDKEGLVIQGCGGDLRDWQNGINDVLTKAEILLDGTKFNDCISFKNNGVTCMIYPSSENYLNNRRKNISTIVGKLLCFL